MEQQLKSAAAWFEIPCADLDRAQRFYETILGCRMKKNSFGDDQELMCIFPAEPGGVAGALVKRPFQQPGNTGTMVYLNCDGELKGTIARVPGAGGTILIKPTPVPGGFGAYACLKDSEGNHVGLHTSF
jgi:uncharacterized protein